MVADLLGRKPQGDYEIILRRPNGWPVILINSPLLHSGRPMPTRFWLVDRQLNKAIGRLESAGTIDQVESTVDPIQLAEAHARYEAERDSALPSGHDGPVPTGGVGGTRIGVKCLHAHYAYYLAGGLDPVGKWVDEQLSVSGDRLAFDYEPYLTENPSDDQSGEHKERTEARDASVEGGEGP